MSPDMIPEVLTADYWHDRARHRFRIGSRLTGLRFFRHAVLLSPSSATLRHDYAVALYRCNFLLAAGAEVQVATSLSDDIAALRESLDQLAHRLPTKSSSVETIRFSNSAFADDLIATFEWIEDLRRIGSLWELSRYGHFGASANGGLIFESLVSLAAAMALLFDTDGHLFNRTSPTLHQQFVSRCERLLIAWPITPIRISIAMLQVICGRRDQAVCTLQGIATNDAEAAFELKSFGGNSDLPLLPRSHAALALLRSTYASLIRSDAHTTDAYCSAMRVFVASANDGAAAFWELRHQIMAVFGQRFFRARSDWGIQNFSPKFCLQLPGHHNTGLPGDANLLPKAGSEPLLDAIVNVSRPEIESKLARCGVDLLLIETLDYDAILRLADETRRRFRASVDSFDVDSIWIIEIEWLGWFHLLFPQGVLFEQPPSVISPRTEKHLEVRDRQFLRHWRRTLPSLFSRPEC
ncbi:MAG: hypothetical protein AAF664_12135 [Planctomycetota bacterium]